MKVYKYKLEQNTDEQVIEMPYYTVPLSFGFDSVGALVVWAAVDNTYAPTAHRFQLLFTGQDIPACSIKGIDKFTLPKFLGTVVLPESGLVVHCFYYGEETKRSQP